MNASERELANAADILGSARVSRAGEGVLAIANFLMKVNSYHQLSIVRFGGGAEMYTRRRMRSPEAQTSLLAPQTNHKLYSPHEESPNEI